MIFKKTIMKRGRILRPTGFSPNVAHLFLTPARPRLLGGIRQAFQSAQKEGYRGFIALFLGALPGQIRCPSVFHHIIGYGQRISGAPGVI